MFGNQLAMLSLLLLGLSLSSHLSEAVRDRHELLYILRNAVDPMVIFPVLIDLGEEFQIYADLSNIKEWNCTPERLLFVNKLSHLFGKGAKQYVEIFLNKQRKLCEQTFIPRLKAQYTRYKEDWYGKDIFQEFIDFVKPWPTLNTEAHQMIHSIRANIESYKKWRMEQPTRFKDPVEIHYNLLATCEYVYSLLGSFSASLRASPYFHPELDKELTSAVALGMIADVARGMTPNKSGN